MSLKGKVAFLTGGVGGIGQCITKNLLDSGVTVVLFDLNKAKGEETQKKLEAEYGKGKVHFISGSVTKKEDIEAAFKEAVDKYSRIDYMFNNAGIMDDAVWEAQIDINLYPQLYEKTGVKVIAFCPGLTETELLTAGNFGTMFQAFISQAPPEQRAKHPSQKPESIGVAIPKILQEASNGSIWVVEGGEPGYEISIPFYPEWKVQNA
ncbi:hypothetical protein J437_LFUL002200 [Ladona fulva]|uniref:Uncharacterized protein n=1 Tax=Ladona fulva TaxID=123851 RepID=A0A8K0JV54_LADFU|nr:hypothetical protein J437_LFUL002200 [Ladona fulva]